MQYNQQKHLWLEWQSRRLLTGKVQVRVLPGALLNVEGCVYAKVDFIVSGAGWEFCPLAAAAGSAAGPKQRRAGIFRPIAGISAAEARGREVGWLAGAELKVMS